MKYYQSPRWSHEIPDCSMPMTFDTYSNCSYGCIYCFSQYQRAINASKDDYLAKRVKVVNVERIIQKFDESLAGKDVWQFSEYIRQRRVMQWGGLSDQFDGNERARGETLRLLRYFKEINYPLCFSTKATWWTRDSRYSELFIGQKNWNVKFSIITLDEEKAHIIERGAPTPNDRLEALETVAGWNCGGATLRLRPFIIGISTPSYKELIERAADAGATAMSTEFFCADMRSPTLKEYAPTISKLCGFDFMTFYRKYSAIGGYCRLNRNVKRPFIRAMKEVCDRRGVRFYVSDAHFKELCANGSCCGLPADWNYSRGQFCEALQIAKRHGSVRWSDISQDAEQLYQCQLVAATGYNYSTSEIAAKFDGMSLADFLHYLWNNPQCCQSPYRMFEGVLIPDDKDENGDFVYRYNPDASI